MSSGGYRSVPSADGVREMHTLIATQKKENDTLNDEITIKNQMIVSLANSLHQVREELTATKASAMALGSDVQHATADVTSLKDQVISSNARCEVAERRIKDLEEQIRGIRKEARDLQTKVDGFKETELDLKRVKEEKNEADQKLEHYISRTKDALHALKRKEQDHLSQITESRHQITDLQEKLDAANFQIQTSKVKAEREKTFSDISVQTDKVEVPPTPATSLQSIPIPVIPPPLVPAAFRSPSPNPMQQSRDGGHHRGDQRGNSTPTHVNPEADPFFSPPVIRPEPSAEPLQPFIVTIHYNEGEFSVNKKIRATPGMAVADLIAKVCEQVNRQYEKDLDCATMCLKTLHVRAKRYVVLSEHRELHSFAYFQKCAKTDQPVLLYLEPIPANAVWASPTGRVSGRLSASATRADSRR